MASVMDLLNAKATEPSEADGASVPQQASQAPAGANPLAALIAARSQAQQQPPAPTHAQTVAVMHRLGEIKSALKPVVNDPNLGTKNIRPKLLDAASKLLGSKVLSLTEIMNAIKGLPEDPLAQKKFVDGLYSTASQGQLAILEQHRNANLPEPGQPPDAGADEWMPEGHNAIMDELMQQYGGGHAG